MLQSVAAVVAGFVSMAVIVMIGSMAIVAVMVPGGLAAMRNNPAGAMPAPTPRYYAMNIALSLLGAIVGGLVTARIAPDAVSNHLAALAALVVAMGLMSARMTSGTKQPRWYKVLMPLIGVAGVSISAVLVSVR